MRKRLAAAGIQKININYCDFDGRGMCHQGKEKNRISNQIRNQIKNNFYFLINQNVSKFQIILISLKKGKKAKKEIREDDLQCEIRQRTNIKVEQKRNKIQLNLIYNYFKITNGKIKSHMRNQATPASFI